MRRLYPKTGRIVFDGGLNNKFERSIIPDNESPDCLNVVFTNGAVETRQGTVKLNSTAIGSFAIDGLYTRRTDTGSETMVVFAGGSMWGLAGTSFGVIASAQSVFTAGLRVATTQYENHMFIGNGGVTPYKYNGTDFTRHGVYPPTDALSASSNGAGALSGAFAYKVTFVNSQLVEGSPGPASTTFSVASRQILLNSIPVAPQSWGVNSRRIYRTVTSGSTYLFLTELMNNTATTYSDNALDATLGVAAPSDAGVPPNYSVCAYHQNRLFVNDPANPNFVNYSDLNEPYTFGALSFIRVGDAASDVVKTISVYGDHILVGCEKSRWLIYMPDTDPTNWKPVRIKSAYGDNAPFCQLDFDNRHLTVAMESGKFLGFQAISGNTVEPEATLLTVQTAGSDLLSDRIEPDMFEVQENLVGRISGIIFKNKAWLALTYGSGQTANNRIYVMDFSISNLSRKQKLAWVPFTGPRAEQFTIYNGNLYYGSSTATGFIYQLEAGVYSDDGAAIDSYFWTKEFSGFDPDVNAHKDFRYANLLVEKLGNYYMNVTYRVDSDTGIGNTQQINLDPGGSLWGSMVWGTDIWGGGVAQENIRLELGSSAGKRIQFMFSNQNVAGQRFKVNYMNFTYNRKGER